MAGASKVGARAATVARASRAANRRPNRSGGVQTVVGVGEIRLPGLCSGDQGRISNRVSI